MRKAPLLFVLAVLTPSLVLAWLAMRSLRDQQFLIERQRALLYQSTTDSLVKDIVDFLGEQQREFGLLVEKLTADAQPSEVAPSFDSLLQQTWSLAELGFVVSLEGRMLCPAPSSSETARRFRLDNDQFLCSRESVEVYANIQKGGGVSAKGDINPPIPTKEGLKTSNPPQAEKGASSQDSLAFLKQHVRNVMPSQKQAAIGNAADAQQYSKISSAEAEFRQLIGDADQGMLARFLQNKLKLMMWYRAPRDPQLVFGAQLNLSHLIAGLTNLIRVDAPLDQTICLALLDDSTRPVALSQRNFTTTWKRPFVASEIGEMLPHWEIAAYLLNPAKLSETAKALRLTMGLLIGVLVVAISIGGWLIVADANRQATLARQKTDFVSNVSHELKTPLTSIRMFSELLAEGRVADEERRRSYLHIIVSEATRLTRLINNVLEFARLERGEKKYNLQSCDVPNLVRETLESYRPHLEARGFRMGGRIPDRVATVNADRDALAQVLVNLLSNAEKYSGERKEIEVEMEVFEGPPSRVEVRVLDRGLGVPQGCGDRIFEQFYRAHDSLNSGIQGSGLGLTLARQVARAHGGDVRYEPREGGGSCFTLSLPCPTQDSSPL